MGPILVFGHRNPDNDSICSAVAYAHLKNLTDPDNVYLSARLGPVPRETQRVFERFGVALPDEISHVFARVRDVMSEPVVTVRAESPMLEAGRLMRERGVRALPVVDADGRLAGLVSQRMLAERYLEETEIAGFAEQPVTVARLVSVLDGDLLAGDDSASLSGRVLIGAGEPETMASRIESGDVLIVGDRVRTQPLALHSGVACLIVTGGFVPGAEIVSLAAEKGAALVVTPHDTYSAARLVALAHAVGDLMETDVLTLGPETLLSEAAEELLASTHRDAVVTDDESRVVGILTRTDVARGLKRRVVLVDHNETQQSAPGIESASVVEIVDHHRVGDVQTSGPVLFLNLPVGSTASIVASRFEALGVEIERSIAGVLLSALLTDTVLLKSPTTTRFDRDIAERLAAIAGVDALEFGTEVFRSRSEGEVFSAKAVIGTDAKEFRLGEMTALVAQYETVDLTTVLEHMDALRSEMEARLSSGGYDLVVLMATDIVREGSEIIAVGKTRVAERALGISLESGSAWMPGVLSRKQQVAARLVDSGV